MSASTHSTTAKQNPTIEGLSTPHIRANGQEPPPPAAEASEAGTATATPIPKPSTGVNMDRFKSKRGQKGGAVDTLPSPLPHHKIAHAKDYVRLHPDEHNYWSDPEWPYCFVHVPTPGQKGETLYLINEDIVPPLKMGKIQRFRLALASKPNDIFFLCHVPCDNLDNSWNETSLQACLMAKTQWVEAVSQKMQGKETYAIGSARDPDAFPEPRWPKQSLDELVATTFGADRMIDSEDHPGFIRLVGGRQSVG